MQLGSRAADRQCADDLPNVLLVAKRRSNWSSANTFEVLPCERFRCSEYILRLQDWSRHRTKTRRLSSSPRFRWGLLRRFGCS